MVQQGASRLVGRDGALLENRGTYTLNTERCSGCSFEPGLVVDPDGATPLLLNRGVLQKTEGTGITSVFWAFENLGTIREVTGKFYFYGPLVQEAPEEEESYGPGNDAAPDVRRSCAGKPVDCASGNQFEVQTDLTVGGRGLGLDLLRTYNSRAASSETSPGPFGYGWTASYSDRLLVEPDQRRATVVQSDGSHVIFGLGDDGSISAPDWVQATLKKEEDGTYTYTLPDQRAFTFSAAGRLVSEADRNANRTTISYDGDGHVATITDPAGRTLTYAYDGDLVSSVTDPSGLTVHYDYDAGQLVSVTYDGDDHATWMFGYDGSHELTAMVDARGYTTTTAYDDQHRATAQTDALGRTRRWQYFTDETRVTEPNGSITDLFFANGQPTKIVRAAGSDAETTQRFVYDGNLRTVEVTDGNGHITTFTYDSEGNRTSAADPTGRTTRWTYNASHDLTSATSPSGINTTIERDERGNPTSISRNYSDAEGDHTQRVTMTYDERGQLTSLEDPLEHAATFAYDDAGNQVSQTNPSGETTTSTFDANSRLTSVTSPAGNEPGADPDAHTTTIVRDKLGRPTEVHDPLGHATRTVYDANGNITSVTDGAGRTTSADYDAANQMVEETLGDGATQQIAYDATGAVASKTDGRGQTTTYTRDEAGNLTRITDPLGRRWTKTYDTAGNVVAAIDPLQRTTTYTYDDADRPTKINYPAPDASEVTYGYDDDGRRATMTDDQGQATYTYDGLGRLTRTTSSAGDEVTYGYDLADHRTSVTYPNGHSVGTDYDASGRVTAITDWLGNTTAFDYDIDSNLRRTTFPTSPVTSDSYEHDAVGQLTSITLGENEDDPAQLSYRYNDAGDLTSLTSTGLPGDTSHTYDYDQAGRLAKDGINELAYDLAGNITTLANGAQLSYDAAGQLTGATTSDGDIAFAFDPDGRRTAQTGPGGSATSYGYDGAGNLTSVNPPNHDPITYRYDGDGLRTETRNGDQVTDFAWDTATGNILTENDTSYIYDPDGLPLEEIGGDDVARFYHHDRLGSTRTITDHAGHRVAAQTFNAAGNVIASSGDGRIAFGFAGQYSDPDTGLIYMRARYYDPSTAQFLSRDVLEDLTLQPYAYAGDDPVNAVDPTGLLSVHIGLPSLEDASNVAAGFGDLASFGLTRKIREALGVDNVDYCSAAYGAGGIGGAAIALAIPTERLLGAGINLARGARAAKEAKGLDGAFTTFERDASGRVKKYTTYARSDPRDPVPFRPVKRFDRDGKPHFNKVTGEYVPTPHVHDPTAPGGVRPPRPDEIPR
ncbi:MAG TPA: RHS repeat-associated core domain-containing protein [Solirubrobacteraceae bacterium]